MLNIALGQLRRRRGRAAALTVTLIAATAGFLLLGSAGKTTDVRVQGSVHGAFRPAYDILARPRGSRTTLERDERLVRPNYLSGVFGGITLEQYRRIRLIRGVDVAAPIANVGYGLIGTWIPVFINDLVTSDPIQLYRFDMSWLAQRGLSRYPAARQWVYYNTRDRFDCCNNNIEEYLPHRATPLEICRGFTRVGGAVQTGEPQALPVVKSPFDPLATERILCWSKVTPRITDLYWTGIPHRSGAVGTYVFVTFPIFISAIDPGEEAKLLHLSGTIISGRYLRANEGGKVVTLGAGLKARFVPAIVSARSFVDEALVAPVVRLRPPQAAQVPFRLAAIDVRPFLLSLRGKTIATQRYPARGFYRSVIVSRPGTQIPSVTTNFYWNTSPVRYRETGRDRLTPLRTQNPVSVWRSAAWGGWWPAPPSNQDVQFRRLREHEGSNLFDRYTNIYNTPSFRIVGRYDPAKLPGFSPLSRVPLETYYPPLLQPGDKRTSRLLHDQTLLPTQNLGDYIQQPPMLLTTLKALPAFTNAKSFSNVSPRMRKAPIAAIRVRVAGVKGPDSLSIARIKAVAAKIHDQTGLDVDITAGSSPHPVLIDLPKGKFGRPPLTLKEGWSKKGVSISFLSALDSKRLGFLVVILLSSAFVVANGAFASVRQRRREIGTLLCLGWSPGEVFRTLLSELALLGLVAGLLGATLADVVAAASTLSLAWWQPLLVVPLALGLALVSGLLPAWQASRLVPLDAVRPPVSGKVEGRPVRHLAGLALANLRRVPVRSLVAVAGLTVGVTALALLVAIDRAFQGTLVGTLLGGVVSLQVRGLDYLAVGLLVALSALALADVLYVNLRERQAELVTLRSLGWADAELRRLVALEAGLLGLLGSLAGALLALLIGGLVGLPLLTLLWAALAAGVGGVVVALVASLLPLSQIGRFSVPTVLAEE
jgi:putative ABC transport system permease protein